jgi:hypothetical protein
MAVFTTNVNLETDYGITWDMGPLSNGISTIGDEFPVGTDAARVNLAKAKYPYWIGWCLGVDPSGNPANDRTPNAGSPAWTNAQILACSSFTAAWNDAVWSTGGAIGANWIIGALPLSRCNIIVPHGSFYVNYPLMLNFGTYIGQGCEQSAPDLNDPPSQICFGTAIRLWHEEWLDIASYVGGPIRQCCQSINWPYAVGSTLYAGVNGANGGVDDANFWYVVDAFYMQGCVVKGIYFDGRKSMAPEAVDGGDTYVTTYQDAGIAILRPGSNSGIYDCRADNFNNAGFQVASSVPIVCQNLRSFDCNYAGFWQRGTGTTLINGFECDECPTMIKAEGFLNPLDATEYIIEPGGKITVNSSKIETGTSGVTSRYKGTMLFDGVGWCKAVFSGVSYAASNIYPELLCRVTPKAPNYATYLESYVRVDGLHVFGSNTSAGGCFRTLMHHADGADSKKWMRDKDQYFASNGISIAGFVYNSANGGTLVTDSGEAAPFLPVPYENRQDFLTAPLGSQVWDDTGDPGLPTYTNPAS